MDAEPDLQLAGAGTSPCPPWADRRHPTKPARGNRTEFDVDRDRITHSETFRELQYKTQVQSLLHAPLEAPFRTRLNHVLEVAQLARALARELGGNEALAEAIALAHDLGHPPFGHAGERALRDALAAYGAGSWNANVHSLAVVDDVECAFAGFRGLNLTWATREGIARHSTPFDEPVTFGEFVSTPNGGLECQLVDAADVLAYLSHDLDDAMVGGYIKMEEVVEISPFLASLAAKANLAWNEAPAVWPASEREVVKRRTIIARLIGASIVDLTAATAANAAQLGIASPEDVRAATERLVVYSFDFEPTTKAILALLVKHYYRSEAVADADAEAGRILRDLFEILMARIDLVPSRFLSENQEAIGVATYLASLNDRTAAALAHRLGIAQELYIR